MESSAYVSGGRRRLLLGLLLTLLVGVSGAVPLAGALDPVTAGSDDRVVLDSGRGYILHTPAALRRSPALQQGRPVMVVLHGLESDPPDAAKSTGFSRLADRDDRLVAYPEGVRRSFNAGLCCGESVPLNIDDVAFLEGVLADLRRRGAGRISVVGFSNGAMMAYRFGCARPNLVDTVGVMSGTLEVPRCAGPIKALHLHGEKDTAVPVAGDEFSTRLSAYLRPLADIGRDAPGSSITIREIPGFPHRWTEPQDAVDATEEFWAFARMNADR